MTFVVKNENFWKFFAEENFEVRRKLLQNRYDILQKCYESDEIVTLSSSISGTTSYFLARSSGEDEGEAVPGLMV